MQHVFIFVNIVMLISLGFSLKHLKCVFQLQRQFSRINKRKNNLDLMNESLCLMRITIQLSYHLCVCVFFCENNISLSQHVALDNFCGDAWIL